MIPRSRSNLAPFFMPGSDQPPRPPLWTHELILPALLYPLCHARWDFTVMPCFCKILPLHTPLLLSGMPFTIFSVWKIPGHPSQLSSTVTCRINFPLTSSNLSSTVALPQTNKQTSKQTCLVTQENPPFSSPRVLGTLIQSFKCFLQYLTVLDTETVMNTQTSLHRALGLLRINRKWTKKVNCL